MCECEQMETDTKKTQGQTGKEDPNLCDMNTQLCDEEVRVESFQSD